MPEQQPNVYVVMTQPNYHMEYGKCVPGQVVEVPKDVAVNWRKLNLAKPASKEQAARYVSNRYASSVPLEEEEYVEAETVTPTEPVAPDDDEYEDDDDDDDDFDTAPSTTTTKADEKKS